MVDFGDKLIIESYRIPWLIWIQILVFFLLLFLLFEFGAFAPDLIQNPSASSTSGFTFSRGSSSEKPAGFRHDFVVSASRLQTSQAIGTQSLKYEIAPSITRIVVRREDSTEDEGPSSKDSRHGDHHPCHFIRLARSAFLKCLGLDHTSGNRRSAGSKKER